MVVSSVARGYSGPYLRLRTGAAAALSVHVDVQTQLVNYAVHLNSYFLECS